MRRDFKSKMVLFLLGISALSVFGQQSNLQLWLPNGKWSFGIHPYRGSGGQGFPVVVGSVTSEVDMGVGATKVGVVNNSNNTVVALKFKWLVFESERREKILLQGSTPLLLLKTPLAPGGKRILLYQAVSLLKVYRPLLKNGVLNGDYEAEILVEEVYFADKSIWRFEDDKADNTQLKIDWKIIRASFAQCPKQKCKSNTAGTGETVFYSCEASAFNEICMVSSNARSCTNMACGFGGGAIMEEPVLEVPQGYLD